ncbi:CoA transferase [Streptomyces sp. NBC_00237]|uniref:CoA transferase n=1 Tax=Streptomyces sp. NBC_00237 TaxID=2975687 RepID=UPI00224CDB10|nr:CoA transferase [Streptomyces sp. NBC_00237]MCX5206558.1 CoA transferase [Streptomyces sp. NBC_00237]
MTLDDLDAPTVHAWSAVGGRPELAERVAYEGAGDVLPAQLPVRQLARATVGAASLAAAELAAVRGGGDLPQVRVSEGAVATAFHSERNLRIDGRAPINFAPLSGFWRTADSWVRTHANYPHHRARLLSTLGIAGDGSRDDRALAGVLAAELATREAREVQETVYAGGGLAVALAPAPTAAPDVPLPLVEVREAEGSGPSPRRLGESASAAVATSAPAEGVRVLDLTRVLAGPVAGRTLALLGADVLRVDAPQLREDADTYTDTGMGKRSTLLDLGTAGDREVFEELLATADVVLSAYRPGSLDRHGLAPEALLERRPDLIVAQLCAWGWAGPWAGRRGFDSLVQVGTGIAAIEGEGAGEGGRPGALPAQALDHGTGYLIAAGVLRGLTERQETGRGRHLRFSLVGTASWLMHGLRPEPPTSDVHDEGRWMAACESPYGKLGHALPPVAYEGGPANWARPVGLWGADAPSWR